ncbi:unnamed protein product [Discosporangium mesarthrocarpum]
MPTMPTMPRRCALVCLGLLSVRLHADAFIVPHRIPPASIPSLHIGGRGWDHRGRATNTAQHAAGRGIGKEGGGNQDGGRGRGRGGSKKKEIIKTVRNNDEPSRLEVVPEDKLDEIYLLREEHPGRVPRVIECYADRFAVVGGQRYIIAHPCDWAVSVCIPKGEDGVEAVPLDSELMDEIFPGMQRELEEGDIHLFRTPITLTLQGEFLDEEEEEEDEEDEEDEDEVGNEAYSKTGTAMWEGEEIEYEVVEEPEEDGEEEEEEEDLIPTEVDDVGVELIASYWHDNQEYALVKHLEPVFIIAKEGQEGYDLLSQEEVGRVNPIVEKLMEEEMETAEAMEMAFGKNINREIDAAVASTEE